jgi:hypothetical protein
MLCTQYVKFIYIYLFIHLFIKHTREQAFQNIKNINNTRETLSKQQKASKQTNKQKTYKHKNVAFNDL